MKRFRIDKQKNGIAIWDNINKFYIIDASTIQEDGISSISKNGTKKDKTYKWETKYGFKVVDVFKIIDVKEKSVKVIK